MSENWVDPWLLELDEETQPKIRWITPQQFQQWQKEEQAKLKREKKPRFNPAVRDAYLRKTNLKEAMAEARLKNLIKERNSFAKSHGINPSDLPKIYINLPDWEFVKLIKIMKDDMEPTQRISPSLIR
jgi:hypothetical protein